MQPTEVSIITVTYNSASVIGSLLKSVPENARVIVVDNASTDNTVEIATKAGADVISLEKNIGFGSACNVGAAEADSTYLFFANPDSILEKETLVNLIDAAKRLPNASAFNPLILSESGKPSMKRRSLIVPKTRWLKASDFSQERTIPTLSGAAIFCRKEDFDKINGFDTNIFLFHEDDDLATRFETNIGPLYFVPEAKVTHHSGNSSARSPRVAAIKGFAMGQSRVYVLRKHGIKHAYLSCIFRSLVQLVSPVTLISKRRRTKAISILRGVISAR